VVKILNFTKNTVIASRADIADTFLSRLLGLLGRRALKEGEALIIRQCQSIHMFFMLFPIDAIFVGSNNAVVGWAEGIKPFQLSRIFWKASYVIEVPVGTISRAKVSQGDEISIENFFEP